MSAQNPTSLPTGIDASPEPAPVDQQPIPGPYAANLGDGANGLSDEERDLLRDWWDEETTVSVESAFPVISRIVREHTERAWDEVVQMVAAQREAFLDSPGLDPAWISGWHAAIDHATHTSRAARQETNR